MSMFKRKPKINVGTIKGPPGQLQKVHRHDLGCGLVDCEMCLQKAHEDYLPVLDVSLPIMLPDASVLSHNLDILESPLIANVIFLSSVVKAVERRSRTAKSRIQSLCNDPLRKAYIFVDDHHSGIRCERAEGEQEDAFLDRAVRGASMYLASHWAQSCPNANLNVVTVKTKGLSESEETSHVSSGEKRMGLGEFLRSSLGDSSAPLLEHVAEVSKEQDDSPSGVQLAISALNLQQSKHLSPEELNAGIASGVYVQGKFKASDASPFFGEVRCRPFPNCQRLFLSGRGGVNRAIHGDTVAVKVLPLGQWKAPRTFPKGSTAESYGSPDAALAAGFEPTGTVVGIVAGNRRPYCGSIDEESFVATRADGSTSVNFQPKAGRIPRIRIQVPTLDTVRGKRLAVVIDEWSTDSAYPSGHYVSVLGRVGDKDTEATVILMENDIPHYDFSPAVYDCLPRGEWRVEESELAVRRDLRHLCVCSVDPLNCRDIDDALHWRVLPNGNEEVGVHIADVSHFLKERTPMDDEAQKRSTSVYLVDRRINMLPQLLTENLCSIVGGEERYAFSAVWEFKPGTVEVVNEWFGKSVIKSRAALYYGDAQKMIESNSKDEVSVSLRGLMVLSRLLNQKRMSDGALNLASQEFKFKVDNDHVNPTDMMQYITYETNSMVEEWMLYANVAAARRIYSVFPKCSLLRRHEPPADGAFDEINKALQAKGISILRQESSKALNESLTNCVDPQDDFFNRMIRMLATRCLRQAQYFNTNDVPFEKFQHYGLAMSMYTHFTSPIRRYADCIVHRLLWAISLSPTAERIAHNAALNGALSQDKDKEDVDDMELIEQRFTSEQLTAICDNINYRHEQAQRAGRDSQNLFTGFYLRGKKEGEGIPNEVGYVIKISDSHVHVLVSSYGQEGRIPIEDVPCLLGLKVFDRVVIKITLLKEGDVLSAKLIFSIVGVFDPKSASSSSRITASAKSQDDGSDEKEQNNSSCEDRKRPRDKDDT